MRQLAVAACLSMALLACNSIKGGGDEAVRFRSADGSRLAGTLSLPAGQHKFAAVLLVHGGGPMNRDEQIGPDKPFAQITQALVTAGYAVLRYDKRGVGESTSASTSMTRARLLADANAAIDLLTSDARIDAARVFAIGHSEGGELVLGVAAAKPVRGIVMLAPLPKPYLAELHDQMNRLPRDRPAIDRLIKNSAGFFHSYNGVDPRREIASIEQPMLLLHGTKDVQVLRSDIRALERAAKAAGRDLTYQELPNDDHFFSHPFDPRALKIIISWLNAHGGSI